tara:strand:- start:2722 stop:3570 length:849 start_codon:yes stop_codon:yes gene_type:complete
MSKVTKIRYKHNKKRNTAFIFEALCRELTRSIISKNVERKANIVRVLREHFSADSPLMGEVNLYKCLYEVKNVDHYTAEKILYETKLQYRSLPKNVIYKKQSALIEDINKNIDLDVFASFVPNYKNLATIYQIFNGSDSPRKKVILENGVLENMTDNKNLSEATKQKSIDTLTVKTFLAKFNKKYSNGLLEEQKSLLGKYITSFVDNGLELKIFINEEIERAKGSIVNFQLSEQAKDENVTRKLESVLRLMEGYKKKRIDSTIIEELLKIQGLLGEIEKNGN